MGAVTCDIQYSGVARGLVAGAAWATMGLVLVTPVAPHWQALGLAWTGVAACFALRRQNVLRSVRVDEEGAIEVLEGGRRRAGRVRPGCVVFPWLTVIHWRPTGARFDRAVFLIPPMVHPAPFRALRVVLRWGKP